MAETIYLTSFVAGDKFQSFLTLSEKLGENEDTLVRGFRGFSKNGIHRKGKHVDWIKVVIVTHLASHR